MQYNYSLKDLNTFGFDQKAKKFLVFSNEKKITDLFNNQQLNAPHLLILGGGSNLLFTKDFDGLVLKNEIKSIIVEAIDTDRSLVKAGGGVVWDDLVSYCVDKELRGIENLSLIPGTVGAAPVQNIGAYGVELKNVFHSLRAFDIITGKIQVFDTASCAFGYRDSYFKRAGKGRYIITEVSLMLSSTAELKLDYGTLKQELGDRPVLSQVRDAVISIRRSKLPDPKEIGNAGSFFKNPEIYKAHFQQLKEKHNDMPGYILSDNKVKIPAGWLIEKAGWKGRREGAVGVHTRQALVLVHYGGGRGEDIVKLSTKIQENIKEVFNIVLEPEVNLV